MSKNSKSPLFVIFTTVLVDLIGFGMVIPLVSLYGQHFGAEGLQLPVLGGIYSLMQFIFAPFWGKLSDRVGRRPVILVSLLGSTLSYVIFALAPNLTYLLIARAFGGIFAANISTAQAYIADVTSTKDRARGMGLIGAAFGIGFTLGPPLGGIASHKLGLAAPGFIAAAICGFNFLLAIFRLPESFPAALRKQKVAQPKVTLAQVSDNKDLVYLLLVFFLVTFAFSNMEQTFSLLYQVKFGFETSEAGFKTGLVLMASGILGAVIQGGLIKDLVPRFGERKLLLAGLFLNALAMIAFPYSPSYEASFFLAAPLSLGSALINPSLSALISKCANAQNQGSTLGISQGLGSLARATGPFCGLYFFGLRSDLPYIFAAVISVTLLLSSFKAFSSTSADLEAA